ncbi:transmembrane protein 245 isoform X3 [Condylostylus longicornis]|uniref:transmembrane protein 245 isoform X3 n=1 Tax=Condylostylus longicornis TaxID=2530218 RepID=UPI00244E3E69|nr:transmembrane protein 245 isoform X3 [Condylostylus longicornis]
MNNRPTTNSIRRDRSFDSVLNKILRMKSDNNESFKAALYNFLIALGISAFVVVCFILGPFVRPLIWAFLIGAFLFPFKRKLASLLHEWFEGLEENDTNIFVAISFAPIQTMEYSGRLLVNWLKKHWQILTAGLLFVMFTKIFFLYAPMNLFCWIWRMIIYSHSIFSGLINFLSIYQVILLVSLYVSTVIFFWSSKNATYFSIIGQLIWIILIGYICSFLGALQVPVFLFLMLYCAISIIYYIQKPESQDSEKPYVQTTGGMRQRFMTLLDKNIFKYSIEKVYLTPSEPTTEENSLSESLLTSTEEDKTEHISDYYFKYLFYACLFTFMYRNIWMYLLVVIPIAVHLFYHIGAASGLWDFCRINIEFLWKSVKEWSLEHHSAVLPLCLPGLLELNYKIQTLIRSYLRSSVDLVTSIIMIVLMILLLIFVSVFFCINIYSETIEVAYLGKDLINKTITNRPDLIDVLPENIQDSIDDALDNAHTYGRRRIEQYINDLLKDADAVHAEKLKNQILSVWDRLIQYWFDFNKTETFGPRVPSDALKITFEEIVDNPVAKQGILGWAKSNTNTILEVAESIWHIVRTNISMIMAVTGGIFSILLSGGQAFVEFLLDMIVFFTALFYLLSTSGKKYAPLQIGNYFGISSGSKIADALENSISGVLIALLKCSVFQGMFTWLIHTIFGARIVFLPSALAAILSAAPFLGSYWCGLPAFLELWLAQDRFYAGVLLMALLFFVPPYLEQEVHSEIKGGGHPYLTGLAIAGGMYWMGWQGAIFGPLMLCLFIGIFEVTSVTLRLEEDKSLSEEESKVKLSAKIVTNAEDGDYVEKKENEEIDPKAPIRVMLVRKTVSTVLPNNPIPWSAVSGHLESVAETPNKSV